jgi:His-Xaa-Ser system radical SAM maturase HxsB
MSRPQFKSVGDYQAEKGNYGLFPFRFARLEGAVQKVLVTSEVGEYSFLDEAELYALVNGKLDPSTAIYSELQAKHFLYEGKPELGTRLLAAKYRTKKSPLRYGPSLHIFVVSLRCDHSCPYCQVSRQSLDKSRFDMTDETAMLAIERLFESSSPALTVEFQGGEPLLAFEKIKLITENIAERNETERRKITFSITTTLHFVTDEILEFFKNFEFQVSTSLDGPDWLHDKNRIKQGGGSHAKTIENLEKTRAAIGIGNVAALTTLTRKSLEHPKEIIDEYVRLGFRSIFLRPLSPYGFAVKTEHKIGYEVEDFLKFYDSALDYILELNKQGIILEEAYTAILLTHILTPFPTGYVDLRSPTGSGCGVLVYNYDGTVYASDESRMLAEMGHKPFLLGTVKQSYAELMQSEAMELILASGVAEALPGCSDCAFLPYCGSDPVFHFAKQGDPVGHRSSSDFCKKHTHLFSKLFEYLYKNDPDVIRIFLAWVTRRAPSEFVRYTEAA